MGRLIQGIVAALVALVPAADARDFGTLGQIYPIEEPDLLATIQSHLARMEDTGRLAALKDEAQKRTRSFVERPPGRTFPRASAQRVFDIDLSIQVDRDITDHRGQVFVRAGTRINPLEYSRFKRRIILIDGDDPDQVAFALAQGNEIDTLIVLVAGAPLALMRAHGRRFFFDQHGVLAERFEIEAVPAVVTRADPVMRVREVLLANGEGSDG